MRPGSPTRRARSRYLLWLRKALGRKKAAWRIDKEDLARAEKTPYPSEYPRAVTCNKKFMIKKKSHIVHHDPTHMDMYN